MSIRILEYPEPLTGASGQRPSLLIESEGLRVLKQELRRYCDQNVSGRSFLVAGHRGSGKTTLVQGAIQQTDAAIASEWTSSRLKPADSREAGAVTMRPLFILLQGPNLLPADAPEPPQPAAKAQAEQPATPASGAAAPGEDTVPTPDRPENSAGSAAAMETVLSQIILGLYRALAGEFARSYGNEAALAAGAAAKYDDGKWKRTAERQMELAAQFELELDQYPTLARLREYWRLSRSLERGLLFRTLRDPRLEPGQGYRELIALASASQAYQRICGKLSRKDESSSTDKTKRDLELAMEAKSSELLKPLTSLLAGGTVGAGLAASGAVTTPFAVFAGLAAALLSTWTLKYTRSRSTEQSAATADLFIPDLSVATLDRVLPVLLNRIRRAGLAPVFVIDELDKVDLTRRITEMVKRLKKLVAENAFFCFLSDRQYYEELVDRTADAPYPIEYTYFTNQLFLIFRHGDMHAWLDSVLEVPKVPTPQPIPGGQSQTAPPPPLPRDEFAEDRSDKELLQFVLLHDAQMHPIDLRRQIVGIRGADGAVTIPRGEVRSRRHYPFAIRIQVAIELLLDGDELRVEIERRPAFLQLAHDGLFFLSRRWRDAPKPLDLSDTAGKAAFETYLCDRKATTASLTPRNGKDHPGSRALQTDADTVDLLFRHARKLADYLAKPGELVDDATASGRFSQTVLDVLTGEPLLFEIAGRPSVYTWTRNAAGRRLTRQGTVAAQAPQPAHAAAWEANVAFIAEFEQQLSRMTHHAIDFTALTTGFGLVRTSPAWPDVRRAIERLKSAKRDTPYADQPDDMEIVRLFRANLLQGATAVNFALVAVLAITPDATVAAALFWTLAAIAEALRLTSLTPEGTAAALYTLVREIAGPDKPFPETVVLDDREKLQPWAASVTGFAASIQVDLVSETQNRLETEAWAWWEQRLRYRMVAADPPLAAVVARARSFGPGALLNFDPAQTTIERWTLALTQAIAPDSSDIRASYPALQPANVPQWMALAALQNLHVDALTIEAFSTYLSSIGLWDFSYPFTFAEPSERPPERKPAGLLICRRYVSRTYTWLPAEKTPLLVCDLPTAKLLAGMLSRTARRAPDLLGLAFVAFDFSEDTDLPATEAASTAAASSAADPLFRKEELDLYDRLAPDPRAPKPVMVDDLRRYPALDPAHTFTGITGPAQLFEAVARTLPKA